MAQAKHFFTKAVGVTHTNDDGSNRQKIIRQCKPGEPLTFDHDENNPKSKHALRIMTAGGRQVGWVKDDLAEQVLRDAAKGWTFTPFVAQVTGEKTHGLNLVILKAPPGTLASDAQAYANEKILPEVAGRAPEKAGCLGVVALIGAAFGVAAGWVV